MLDNVELTRTESESNTSAKLQCSNAVVGAMKSHPDLNNQGAMVLTTINEDRGPRKVLESHDSRPVPG